MGIPRVLAMFEYGHIGIQRVLGNNEINKVIENEDVVNRKDMKYHFNKRLSMNGSRRLESRLNSINFANLKQQF